ncbi:MAG: hypothetical protein Q9209_006335 [Squamulea sp. 1 TL-2023]
MPNKHSHAFVLSRYESRGFITLSQRPSSPPPASFTSSESDLYAPNNSSDTSSPSLNTVPALSDSSTTSTGSSLHEPARPPSHGTSSSIITEIYAPQSPLIHSEPSIYNPTEEALEPALPHPPPRKQPQRQPSPQPPTSRYSSFHDLSTLLEHHFSASKSSKRSSRKRQHSVRSESPQPFRSSTTTPVESNSHRSPPVAILPQPPAHHHTLYHKRLEPALDIDSLESLSLEELEQEGRQSLHMDVLPWEYPDTQTALPSVYRPRGFFPPNSVTHLNLSRTTPCDPTTKRTNYKHARTSSALAAATIQNPNPQSKKHPPPPSTYPTISISHNHSQSQSQHTNPLPPYQQPSQPIDPDIFLPSIHPHPLTHQQSDESFDSAAPPPIRITPRPAPNRIEVRGISSTEGSGSGLRGKEKEKEKENERVRIRNRAG